MKRALQGAVVVSLVFAGTVVSMAPSQAVVPVTCNTASGAFAGGNGTTATPYLISSQTQFAAMNTANLMDCEFKLTQDIEFTLGGAASTPTVSTGWSDIFTGVFDGDNHTISGVNVNGGTYAAGLFRIIGAAQIKNVTVVGTVSAPTESIVGGVIGMIDQVSTITNVHSRVNVTARNIVGGLAGWAVESSFLKSSATGNVVGPDGSAGGLIGMTRGYYDNVDAIVTDSFATGSVTSGDGYQGVGGLIGRQGDGDVVITRSFATGAVTGGAGSRQQCSMGCYTVYGTVGGLIAEDYYGGTYGTKLVVTNSVWNTTTTLQSTSADNKGTGKTTAQMLSFDTYDQMSWSIARGYNAAKTWGICAAVNGGYPFLTSAYTSNPCLPNATTISPSHGGLAGGTTVEITGTKLSGVTSVTFGGVNAQSFTVNSATKITAVTPAGTAGAVNVVVADADGNASTLTNAWTYDAPAAPEDLAPLPQSAPSTPTESATSTPSAAPLAGDGERPTSSRPMQVIKSILNSMPEVLPDHGRVVLIKHLVGDQRDVDVTVNFLAPAFLLSTGDVSANRAVMTKSGRVVLILRSAPVDVLVTLKAPATSGKKSVKVSKRYHVR